MLVESVPMTTEGQSAAAHTWIHMINVCKWCLGGLHIVTVKIKKNPAICKFKEHS